jgi:hypothetical protein
VDSTDNIILKVDNTTAGYSEIDILHDVSMVMPETKKG